MCLFFHPSLYLHMGSGSLLLRLKFLELMLSSYALRLVDILGIVWWRKWFAFLNQQPRFLCCYHSPSHSRPRGWLFHSNRLLLDSSQLGVILEDEKKVSIKELEEWGSPKLTDWLELLLICFSLFQIQKYCLSLTSEEQMVFCCCMMLHVRKAFSTYENGKVWLR